QLALAWLLARPNVIAIPKTSHRDRMRENAAVLSKPLTKAEAAELDELFAPPDGPTPLEMIRVAGGGSGCVARFDPPQGFGARRQGLQVVGRLQTQPRSW